MTIAKKTEKGQRKKINDRDKKHDDYKEEDRKDKEKK